MNTKISLLAACAALACLAAHAEPVLDRNARVSGNGSADGSTASATRNTTATNANTGVSYDGSTTWTKGSGFSRSGSCTDSGGNTVTCGTQR